MAAAVAAIVVELINFRVLCDCQSIEECFEEVSSINLFSACCLGLLLSVFLVFYSLDLMT
jgi:hypothetical protein